MNYSGIIFCDSSNGEGIRTTLFVSGCSHACLGCHNQTTWNYKFGEEFSEEVLVKLLDSIDNPYSSGLSLSGGDPLAMKNRAEVCQIVKAFRERFGSTKTIWCWTGYTLDELLEQGDENTSFIIENIDVLVDGLFVESLKDPLLKWRGSQNQRILTKGVNF